MFFVSDFFQKRLCLSMDFMVLGYKKGLKGFTIKQDLVKKIPKIEVGYGKYDGGDNLSIHYGDKILIVEGGRTILGHILEQFVEDKISYVNGFYGLTFKEIARDPHKMYVSPFSPACMRQSNRRPHP